MNSNQNIRMQDFIRKAEEAQRHADQARDTRVSKAYGRVAQQWRELAEQLRKSRG
jgi:hypothetical protein